MPAFLLTFLKNPKILAGLGLVVLIAIIGGYIYFQKGAIENLKEKNADLIKDLEISIAREQAQRDALKDLRDQAKNNLEVLNEYQRSVERIKESINENKRIFEEHNLSNLAAKKPGLIETRVNKATIRVFKQIEDETREFYEANQ